VSDQYSRFLSTNRSEEERRRRKKRKIAAAFVITIMSMIAQRYNRRRPRHIVDPNEELERRVQERKQMLRNLYQGSNIYCYDSLRLSKTFFYDLCAILRERCGLQDTLNMSVEKKTGNIFAYSSSCSENEANS
jgi:RNase adaptor protein for sRNA GlmZ degradation